MKGRAERGNICPPGRYADEEEEEEDLESSAGLINLSSNY